MSNKTTVHNSLASILRAVREAEHDSALIDEIRALVGNCVSLIAMGHGADALTYAQEAVEAAKDLKTEAAQESVWVTFAKLDALLVASGVVEPLEEEVICTMPGAEA